ncbi:hypothetical protein ABZ801_05305 [Actinomadura sp. NPDC047616]|uniref:hypothetical protein n=1 Tax=Actinomadura sp. NPDC047616 TaxID=3155914 RepID=UPI0033C39815
MSSALSTVIIIASLLAAAYSLVTTLRDRAMGWDHLAALGVLEALLVAQMVVGFVKLSGDEGPGDTATFVGYLIGVVLIPVVSAGWGLLERTRWGPGVIVVACLAVSVMVVRLGQLWEGTVV